MSDFNMWEIDKELKELEDKLNKISAYVNHIGFTKLPRKERDLIMLQLGYMDSYRFMLLERKKLTNIKVDDSVQPVDPNEPTPDWADPDIKFGLDLASGKDQSVSTQVRVNNTSNSPLEMLGEKRFDNNPFTPPQTLKP
ncbi:hypothetical protein M1M30_gp134 [Maribacter phage Colly_1]|uniref:Uncharacterized protein n=1 Tax=Maribacter phage Colly_1 TaxID=2745691 RepID=A0A8E4XVN1_9CAUD|nr:hypothetical protein M1M30_gp134 [Maribacter phage Colly_1]QQO97234.1 hypothetical protein Colly1_134 [Maribacter phage Colly_1]